MYWPQCPADIRFWPILGKCKLMGQFFSRKNDQTGVWKKTRLVTIFFRTPSLKYFAKYLSLVFVKWFVSCLWSICCRLCIESMLPGNKVWVSAIYLSEMAISQSQSEATITGCENRQPWKIPLTLEIKWGFSQRMNVCVTVCVCVFLFLFR